MFGFLLAVSLFGIQFWIMNELYETSFIESARFLFWWYALAGAFVIGVAVLSWAGDLGTEGARLRHGVSSALGWMIGLPRVPLRRKSALNFLIVRRLCFSVGAFLLVRGLQPAGATFEWHEGRLWAGAITVSVGVLLFAIVPLLRRAHAWLARWPDSIH